jgi:uncharacterized protein
MRSCHRGAGPVGRLVLMVSLGLGPAVGESLGAADSAPAKPGRGNYERPFELAARPALIALPAGAVLAQGWLRDWCLLARDGYTGHLDELDEAFRQAWSAEHRPTGEQLRFWDKGAWPCEGGGYWFDGLLKLGYVLQDDFLLNKAKSRLDAVVTNMNPNSVLFIWWLNRNNPAHMSESEAGYSDWFPQWSCGFLGRTLTAYYAASGDQRALRALEMAYDGEPGWLRRRFAQTSIYPAVETYTWTGNPAIKRSLTELFQKRVNKSMPGKPPEIGMPFTIAMPDQARPWYEQAGGYLCNDGGWVLMKHVHGVHFNELSAPWALAYLWTGNREFLDAVLRYYDLVERDSLQPYGVMVADECGGPTGASRGTETCTVSAYLWSQLELLRISGQGTLGDRVERAFFNAAPATVSRDFTTHVYTQTPNRLKAAGGGRKYRRTHWPLCCTASLNRFLPNYVAHMWMATCDNGLAATHYGPCTVSALVAERVPVNLTCRTEYPFRESIEITVHSARPVCFPLWVRIPGWCENPRLTVNGSGVNATPGTNGFLGLRRTWEPNDTLRLHFPMSARVTVGRDANADGAPYATVHYGPLLFALPIADTTDANTVDASAPWNYALESTGERLGADLAVERELMPARWDWPLKSPLKLHAQAVRINWDGNALPAKSIPQNPARPERVTLIPYGCTKFRVAMMPITENALAAAGVRGGR